LALARSSDTATLLALADLIAGVRDELGLHASYAASWGIDMAGVEPAPATLAYTEFLLATAATGGLGMVFAAMIPCMRLYAFLGTALDASAAGPYAQWVATYADPAFEALASRLERLLDDHGDHGPPVRAAYRRAMRLELAFFDAALPPSG
jgi:thiaminase/transcriptional activator TenA